MNANDILAQMKKRLAECDEEAGKLRAAIAALEGKAPAPQVPQFIPMPYPVPAQPQPQPAIVGPIWVGDLPQWGRIDCGDSGAHTWVHSLLGCGSALGFS